MPRPNPHDQIRNQIIRALPTPMTHKHTPRVPKRLLRRRHGLAHRPNLIDLQQQPVTRLLPVRQRDALRVGGEQVVADQLDGAVAVEVDPGLPVVLGERVFEEDNRVFVQ